MRLICFCIFLLPNWLLAQEVDYLTGRLNFPISLGQLQVQDVVIPVTIYHHGSALRVAESSNSCGLGWGLSASGSITREVRGFPDDYNVSTDERKGWLFASNASSVNSFTPSGDDDLSNCTDEQDDFNYLEGRGYTKDTEPDIFYVNAPGLSFQFVFGTDGNPKLLTHQDIQISISKDANDVITAFSVISANGMIYNFASGETVNRKAYRWKNNTPLYYQTSYNRFEDAMSYRVSWLLSSLQSSVTGTTAYFSYEEGEESSGNQYYTRVGESSASKADTLFYVRDRVVPKFLSEIVLKNYKVELTWHNGLVSRVAFGESSGFMVKEYEFIYVSMSSATDTGYPKLVKSFLKEIKQVRNCNAFPSYRFQYADVSLLESNVGVPWENNARQDWYGYHNGVFSNKNVPTVYYYSSQADGKRLRILQDGTPTTVFTGNDRAPALQKAVFGALKRIDLPTGGYTEIEYDLNSYRETGVSGDLTGSGIRVKKLISSGGDVAFGKHPWQHNVYRALIREYEYKLPDGSSSGKILYPAVFAFATGDSIIRSVNSLGEPPDVLYTRVIEKISGQGSRLFEFDIPGTYPATSDGSWIATKSKVARNSSGGCPSAGNLKNGYYTFPFAPSSNYNFARGLLLKSAEFSETGTLVRERTLSYVERTVNPTTVKGLVFEKIGNIFHYGQYEVLTGRVKLLSQEVLKEMSEENPSVSIQITTAYTYNTNNLVEQITTTHADGSLAKENFRYAGDFTFTSPSGPVEIALKFLKDNFRHSEIVERYASLTLAGTEKVTGAELITYREANGKVLPYQIYTLPQGVTFTEAYVSGQSLVYDSDYRMVRTFKEYDSNGHLLSEYDDKKNNAGHHYAIMYGAPVASFHNANAKEVIYEGFEFLTGFGLSPSPNIANYPEGRTGEKAIEITSSRKLVSSSVNPIEKGENTYRVSCWVKAQQATDITFKAKNGTTTQASLTLSNPINNQWVYLEGEMNMSGVSSTFTLEIEFSETITLDDIIFIPKSARISHSSFKPFIGITNVSDDRGNSVKYTYDDYGRLLHTFDQERNLVKRNEYIFYSEVYPSITPLFSSNAISYNVNQAITFTAAQNCLANLSYVWRLNDVIVGTNETLVHTFLQVGAYNLKLTVSDHTYGLEESFTALLCVGPEQTTAQLLVMNQGGNGDPSKHHMCNQDEKIKLFTIANIPTCDRTSYLWYYTSPLGEWIPIANDASSLIFNSLAYDFTIICVATVICSEIPSCGMINETYTAEFTVDFIDDQPCQ